MAHDRIDRFGRGKDISRRLERAAAVAINEVLGARRSERVLIITNPDAEVRKIASALYDAAQDAGATPSLVFQPVKSQLDFAEDVVIHALRSEPEIAISVSRQKLGKDRFGLRRSYKYRGKSYDHIFNYLLGTKKSRSFWSPSVSIDMFVRTVPIDYARLRRDCKKLKQAFDKAAEVHITTRRGTDLKLGLRGRKAFTDDGDFSRPGTGGNLPAGEMFISPELGSGEGTVVYDGCISSYRGVIILKNPIRIAVKENLVTKVSGGREARLLRATLSRARKTTRDFAASGKIPKSELAGYLKNVVNLGELGIGLNMRARIGGNMLEDEKVHRTCHIAIGSNYDEDAKALIHLDGLIKHPTIELRGGKSGSAMVMRNGRLLL